MEPTSLGNAGRQLLSADNLYVVSSCKDACDVKQGLVKLAQALGLRGGDRNRRSALDGNAGGIGLGGDGARGAAGAV